MSATIPLKLTQSFQQTAKPEEVYSDHKRKSSISSHSEFNRTRKIRQIYPQLFSEAQKSLFKEINEDTMASSFIMKHSKNNIGPHHLEKCIEQESSSKEKPIKVKYNHLLPQYLKIKYHQNHQILIDIVCQIENTFENQGLSEKGKKILFDDIKINLKKKEGKVTTLHHLKQIYFLTEKLYKFNLNQCSKIQIFVQGETDSYIRRKNIFKQTIYFYLNIKKDIQDHRSLGFVTIPQKEFFQKSHSHENLLITESSSISIKNSDDNRQSLYPSTKSQTQKFINNLLQNVNKREIRHEKQSSSIIQSEFEQHFFKELVIETYLIFSSKNISNIFQVTLIEILAKKFKKYNMVQIKRALKELSNRLRAQQINFLQYLQVHGRTVIQLDKGKFSEANKCMLS